MDHIVRQGMKKMGNFIDTERMELKKKFNNQIVKMTKIKIYSTPTCVFCKQTKEFLKEKKIPFEDIDVSKNRKAVEELVKKSGQLGVPVIDIDGKIIIGFDQDAIEKAIK